MWLLVIVVTAAVGGSVLARRDRGRALLGVGAAAVVGMVLAYGAGGRALADAMACVVLGLLVAVLFSPARTPDRPEPWGLPAMGEARSRQVSLALAFLLPLVLLAPLVGEGYAFALDMVGGPGESDLPEILAPRDGLPTGTPWLLLREAVRQVFGGEAAQLTLLAAAFVALALGAYRVAPAGSPLGRAVATVFALTNAFVVMRVVSGQWTVVAGLAAFVWLLFATRRWLEGPSMGRALAVAAALAFTGVQTQALFLGIAAIAATATIALAQARAAALRPVAVLAVWCTLLSLFWILPGLTAGGSPGEALASGDQATFAPGGQGGPAGWWSVATMRSFWRPVHVPEALVDLWAPLAAVAIFLGAAGALVLGRGLPRAGRAFLLALVAASAVACALVPGTTAFSRLLWDHIPPFHAFRDSSKLLMVPLGLLVLCIPAGCDLVLASLRPHRRAAASAAIVIVVLLAVPGAMSAYDRQLHPVEYPSDWIEARARIDDGPAGVILVLPWHQYLDIGWLDVPDKRVANPARAFFGGLVLQGDDPEIGEGRGGRDPLGGAALVAVGSPGGETAAEGLARLGISHVVVLKEVDAGLALAELEADGSLVVLVDGPTLRLYENPVRGSHAWSRSGDDIAVDGRPRELRYRLDVGGETEIQVAPAPGHGPYVVDGFLPVACDGPVPCYRRTDPGTSAMASVVSAPASLGLALSATAGAVGVVLAWRESRRAPR